jgi:hypothetical protein
MVTATLPLPALTDAPNGTHGPAAPETPTARLTTVTPHMAHDWLASAHPNRPVSRARVKTIARAIAAGLWQVNGLLEGPCCLYEPEILPVPVEVGNIASSCRRQQRFITARKNIVSQ